MHIDLAGAAVAAAIVIGPFVVIALAALGFGADSRPGIGDADRRPWLVGH